jgi:ribosomal protein L28
MSYKVSQTETFSTGNITVSSTGEDPMVWARRKIAERTNKKNIIPLFYREALQYIISKLGTLNYINSDTELIAVKCLHANPERAVAKMKQENNIILPVLSINQNSSANADDRRRGAPQIVNETFWSEEKKRAVRVISEAPRAVDIEYGINIWAKYKANLDQLVEQIRLLFNPHLVVKTSYTNVAQAYIEQEQDQSSVDTSDREERILRRSFTIKLEGYIPNPQFLITSTGEIEELKMDGTIYEKK